MFGEILDAVHAQRPRIHCITNYVTANDCANVLLAANASPIMADAPEESAEITALCDGLVLNMGTLSADRLRAMQISGKTANQQQKAIVLDPVGAGASQFRTESAHKLLETVQLDVIRGNCSEICALSGHTVPSGGVDTALTVNSANLHAATKIAAHFAVQTGAVVVMTGETDIVTDGKRVFCIANGDTMMQRVTGAGCMLSALTAACIAVSPADKLRAAAAAVCIMGVSGELSASRLREDEGNAAFRSHMIDSVHRMTGAQLDRMARFREADI